MSLLRKTLENKHMNRVHVLVQSTTKENMCKRTYCIIELNPDYELKYGTTRRVGDWIHGLLGRR